MPSSRRKWRRTRSRALVAGVPVMLSSFDEDEVVEGFERHQRMWDDGLWARLLRGPFSWQLWIDWHASRRWIDARTMPDLDHLEPQRRYARPNPERQSST